MIVYPARLKPASGSTAYLVSSPYGWPPYYFVGEVLEAAA